MLTVIPIIVGALGMVPKDLEKRLEIKERIETIHIIADQVGRSLENRGNLLLQRNQ